MGRASRRRLQCGTTVIIHRTPSLTIRTKETIIFSIYILFACHLFGASPGITERESANHDVISLVHRAAPKMLCTPPSKRRPTALPACHIPHSEAGPVISLVCRAAERWGKHNDGAKKLGTACVCVGMPLLFQYALPQPDSSKNPVGGAFIRILQ